MKTLASLQRELLDGKSTARALLEQCLAHIDDPAGEGARAFIDVSRDIALATAQAVDTRHAGGVPLPPLAGIPLSIKDLFDVEGEPTRAGSAVLADAAPAPRDAPCIARLRQAGAVFTGRTNMTEFAYSGVGLNPHHDTPRNPWDRATGRIPGGSSSGAAVSVADNMSAAGIGTDTGGSCRIPAALCGLTGYKPTAHRIPLEGVVPLSPSYDSVGAIAPSVRCVATLDAVMAGAPIGPPEPFPLPDLRLLLPSNLLLDDVDDAVGDAFEAALGTLTDAGVQISRRHVEALDELPALVEKGGIVAAEAYAWHRPLIENRGDDYDPRVLARILAGAEQSAADLIALWSRRGELREHVGAALEGFEALVAPTVPVQAPPLSAIASDEAFARLNRLLLRNPSLANALDTCSVSLPCHAPHQAPASLMLVGHHGDDHRLLRIAVAVERALQPARLV